MAWSIKTKYKAFIVQQYFIAVLFLLSAAQYSNAQDWSINYTIWGYDDARSIIETYDKGIVIPIYHVTGGDYFELRKLDVDGNTLWNKKYRFGNGTVFGFIRIIKLSSGGYLVSGLSTAIDAADGDPFILKLNNCFEPEWQVIYNEEVEGYNYINSTLEVPQSEELLINIEGFVRGYTTLLKLSLTGDTILFNKTFSDDLEFGEFHISKNKIFYFGAAYISLRNNPLIQQNKAIVFNMDALEGNVYWSKINRLNDSNDFAYYGTSIQHSENIFLAGYNDRTMPNAKDKRITTSFYLRKVDTSGLTHWHKLLGDTTRDEAPTHIIKLTNNKYVVYCQYYPEPDVVGQFYGKMYVVDSNGNLLHKSIVDPRVINQSTTGFNVVQNMIKTFDGKILTIGQTLNTHFSNDFDVYCKKYNDDLTIAQKGNTNLTYDSLCTKPIKDSTYILPNPKVLYFSRDSFKVDTLPYTEAKVLSVNPIQSIPNINCTIYPNPTNNGVLVSIENIEDFNSKLNYILTNQLGQVIIENKIDMPDTFINLIGKASGVYYLTISDKRGTTLSSYKVIKK